MANKYLSQGIKPKGFISDNGQSFVGFGTFDSFLQRYEFPLPSKIINSKQIFFEKWNFDDTSIIYELYLNGKITNKYHGTMETLFHSIEPYIYKIERNIVKHCLNQNKIFEYIDNSYNHYKVLIFKA